MGASLTPKVVQNRVDALTLAYRCDVRAHLAREWFAEVGRGRGVVVVTLHRLSWLDRPTRVLLVLKRVGADAFHFSNGDLRGVLSPAAVGGWSVEVVFSQQWLARMGPRASLEYGRALASVLGTWAVEIDPDHRDENGEALWWRMPERWWHDVERVRRIDLAADVAGFHLANEDRDAFVRQRRARMDDFQPDPKDEDGIVGAEVQHTTGRDLTGFTICPGGDLLCRIYDKRTELELPGREQKRQVEGELWTLGGWDGAAPVARVEFQIRGRALDEFHARTAAALDWRNLGAIWSYCVGGTPREPAGRPLGWLRLVDPSSATRSNKATIDPRWLAARSVEWCERQIATTRWRMRRGADARQVVGSSLSFVVSRGTLPVELTPAVGEGSDAEAETHVRAVLASILGAAATTAADDLIGQLGPWGALVYLDTKAREAVARDYSLAR